MNTVMTFLLTVAILAGSAVYALKARYTVIQDQKYGTLVIDNWDFKNPRIIERLPNGSWVGMDIVKGGPSVVQFEEESNAKKTEKPAI